MVFIALQPAYYIGPVSRHFNGRTFFNPDNPQKPKSRLDVWRWRMSEHPQWPSSVPLRQNDKPPARVSGNNLRVSYVGHATVLMQTQGLNILTDPIWSERASPVSFYGPRRVSPPGVAWEDLPPVDIVIISHNHYDSLDLPTLKALWQRDHPRIFAPLGNDTIIRKAGGNIQVTALDWRQCEKHRGIDICLGPAQHWSARGLFDRNEALWGAFIIKTRSGNIYFAGDSGYAHHFKEARRTYGRFRFALIPIGAYLPRWFMQYSHIDPGEAAQVFQDLGTPYTLAIHHDIFPLADEPFGQAAKDLRAALKKQRSDSTRFRVLEPGSAWLVP